MATIGFDTQPSAVTYALEDLVKNSWRGQIRIPHFQRGFRWGSRDVIRLFDSVIKGYPIGSLLLWVRNSPAQSLDLGRLTISAPATDSALWVVDGQQRLTSLANALHPDGNKHQPFDICYDLADRSFVTNTRSVEPRYIPLPVLFDLEKLLAWFADAGQIDSDHFTEARRVARLILEFKIPAYLVRQDDENILTDIFDRMNNYGKRLSRAEIFSALFAGPEEGSAQRLSISQIAERIAARTGFGSIDKDTILAAILARRGPDPARDIRTEFDSDPRRNTDFPEENQETAHILGEQAIIRAIEFLQKEAGVPHLAFLAYRALLIALTRFFALFPQPAERNLILLRRLYWRAATSGPMVFRGSFTQMSRSLCTRIRRGDEEGSIRALLEALESAQPFVPDSARFRTNEAGAKVVLCSWWDLRPRSPITGTPYDAESLAVSLGDQSSAASCVYRIYPSRSLTVPQRLLAANRLFVPSEDEPAEEFLSVLTSQHPDIDDGAWEEILQSHCMNHRLSEYWASEERNAFLEERQGIIKNNLCGFLQRMTEWNFEDTPSLDYLDLDDLVELEGLADDDS